jgi:hypothetical protein
MALAFVFTVLGMAQNARQRKTVSRMKLEIRISELSVAPATIKFRISSIARATELLDILISQNLECGAYCVY